MNTTLPALVWDITEPPEPFSDEFGMVSRYAIFMYDQTPTLYVPEDDYYETDPTTILRFIMHFAPLAVFHGAGQVHLTED